MTVILLISLFLIMALIGIPVAVALGMTSFILLYFELHVPLTVMAQRIFSGVDSFPLMAIPFFVLAGSAMNTGGITQRIVDFSNSLIGQFRGGLALINILASMFFGGVSGSAVADTSAVGGVLIPSMIREKYEREFSAAVTAFSSGLGPIIPPSITMVVYGIITGTSVSKLFIAGAVPGLLFGFGLLVITFIIAVKRDYPRHDPTPLAVIWQTFKQVFWALLMPLIIIGGILSGVFTVTEAAAVAAIYSLFVGIFVFREINSIAKIYQILSDSAMLVAAIMFLIGCAKLYSWLLVVAHVPQIVTDFIFSVTQNPVLILLLVNGFMIIIGMFVEANAALIIFVPILFPVAMKVGIDPIHLGIVLVFNLCLGLVTPPVGLCLSLASQIADVPLHRSFRAAIPFFIVGFSVLILITYFPDVVLYLPRLIFK
ncbi:MAG: TRAP transporter large permease [Desulfobacterales bacterium]|jgi:tripartite ATP-independent transporter DctM subunit